MTPLRTLLDDYAGCLLTVTSAGATDSFEKPHASSTLVLTIGPTDWTLPKLAFDKDRSAGRPGSGMHVWSATLDLTARRGDIKIPQACLDAPLGLAAWTAIRLEQSTCNPPLILGLKLAVRRASLPFAVERDWPPGRPDVTSRPEEAGLSWPEEWFEFATMAGDSAGPSQMGRVPETVGEGNCGKGCWTWEAPIDRVWTDPRQPAPGLRDRFVDDNMNDLRA